MSRIEWTDVTWNPVTGCTRVSPGCEHCYAERIARRLDGWDIGYDGTTKSTPAGPRWSGKVNLLPDRLEIPLRWRKPRRVFVCSMSDLFHEDVPDEFIDDVFATMIAARGHVFQVLTKRPERMAAYSHRIARAAHYPHGETGQRVFDPWAALYGDGEGRPWPPPNVWWGVSVEDQQRADERIPDLLDCPAAVRFLSCEPLLASVDIVRWLGRKECGACHPEPCPPGRCGRAKGIAWVIVGGESGPGARSMNIEWVRSIVGQCREAGVACFVKQLGADPYLVCPYPGCEPDFDGQPGDCPTHGLELGDTKGGNPAEWPEDLCVREFPP